MAKKNDITDISLDVTQKKRFRIDKDNDRIIELNTSDMLILSRLKELMPKFDELTTKFASLEDDAMEDAEVLKEIDGQLREYVDVMFDSKVSDVCAPDGSMFDLFNGEFRFEHIINTLLTLYESNIERESSQMMARLKKHTSKYTKK